MKPLGRRGDAPRPVAARALTTLAVVGTYLGVVATVPTAHTWPAVATVASLLVLPAALAASVFAGIAWRLVPSSSVAWFSAAMAMIGVQWPLLVIDDVTFEAVGLVSSAVVVGLALLLLVKVAGRWRLRLTPIPIGVGVGLVLLVVPAAWSRARGPEDVRLPPVVDAVLVLVVGLLVAVAVARASRLPTGTARLTAAPVLWTAPVALGLADVLDHPGWSLVAVALALLAATCIAGTGLELMLLRLHDEVVARRTLERELSTMRDRSRADVKTLHEVKGTIAGIASASELIRDGERLPPPARSRLADMLAAESSRLHRLFERERRDPGTTYGDLDDLVRPLVVAHRLQGRDVVWHRPDDPVVVATDAVAEILSILLDNAAEHAPGAPVRISVRAGAAGTEVVVADLGPGIPDEARTRVFGWGWRSPGSRGRGIGLAIAAEAAAGLGGALRLDPHHRRGTAFVLDLGDAATASCAPGRCGDEALEPS